MIFLAQIPSRRVEREMNDRKTGRRDTLQHIFFCSWRWDGIMEFYLLEKRETEGLYSV